MPRRPSGLDGPDRREVRRIVRIDHGREHLSRGMEVGVAADHLVVPAAVQDEVPPAGEAGDAAAAARQVPRTGGDGHGHRHAVRLEPADPGVLVCCRHEQHHHQDHQGHQREGHHDPGGPADVHRPHAGAPQRAGRIPGRGSTGPAPGGIDGRPRRGWRHRSGHGGRFSSVVTRHCSPVAARSSSVRPAGPVGSRIVAVWHSGLEWTARQAATWAN